MILSLVLAVCAPTKMVNLTNLDWNDFDRQHLQVAKKRCGEIYKKSPCALEFRKRSERDYSVICGKK